MEGREGKGRGEKGGREGVGGFVDGGSEGSMAWRKDNGGLVAAGLTWEFRGLFLFWDCSSNGSFCFIFLKRIRDFRKGLVLYLMGVFFFRF